MASTGNSKLTANQTIVSLRGCPICGGNDCQVLHTQDFVLPEGHPLADGYNVVACEKCGFVYADSKVSQRDYDEFYAKFSKYEDVKTSTGGGGSPEDLQRLKQMAVCIANAIPNRQARLLDIGCAAGGLLKELAHLGYAQLCGIDPSPTCVEVMRAVCGAEGFVGSLASLPEGLGQFDGVFLSHVLEHVRDLQQAVNTLNGLMRPGGLVYVEVPDASRFDECLLAPFQDFNTEHINHFSAESLENLFLLQGWHRTAGGSKTLQAAPGMPYPAVFAFFTKNTTQAPMEWNKDLGLQVHINNYIASSRNLLQQIDEQIALVLAESDEVIVWGTGQLAMKLLNETCLGSARIVAFVDGNPINQGKVLRGHPILAPSQVQSSSTPIVVTSIIQSVAIGKAISEANLSNPVVMLSNNDA